MIVATAEWAWRIVAIAAATVVVGLVLIQFSVIVIPVVLALFIAAVLEPLAAKLRARNWPPAAAAAVVFVGALAAFVGALVWIGYAVAGEMDELGEQVQGGLDEVRRFLTERFDLSAQQLQDIQDRIVAAFRSTGSTAGGSGVAKQVIGGASAVVQAISGLVLTLFTVFFLVKDGHRMADWIRERLPERFQGDAAAIAGESALVMRQYLKATALTGLIDGVLIGIGVWIVGVPLVLPLAVLTFIGGFFPIIGAFLAGMVAALVALVTNGPVDALIVVGITIAVQQIEGNLLQPLILGPAVRLHELVTVLAVAGGLAVGGILGAFLAVPIIAIAVRIGSHIRQRGQGVPPDETSAVEEDASLSP